MKNFLLKLAFFFFMNTAFAQSNQVSIVNNQEGMKLVVDGKDFIVNGMNWDYMPIGNNYDYSLWRQPDDLIQSALDAEMALLKNMGVNTIRVYTGIQPKWITYIYQKYGIYTMLNHSFGRYGLTIDSAWVAVTNYSNPKTQNLLLSEVTEMATSYQNTSGLLFFSFG